MGTRRSRPIEEEVIENRTEGTPVPEGPVVPASNLAGTAAVPLPDPRSSDRWNGPGAIGRFWPGAGPQSEVVMPVEQSPQFPLYQQAQTEGFNPHGNNPFNVINREDAWDYLGDWDYENPPLDNQGIPLDPQLKPLTDFPRAHELWKNGEGPGFDPFGRPFYGEGVGAWWSGVQDRWDAPIGDNPKAADFVGNLKQIVTGLASIPTADATFAEGGTEALGGAIDFFENLGNQLVNMGGTEGNERTALQVPGFVLKEGLGGLLQGIGAVASRTERAIGVGVGTVADLANGSPLPEAPQLPEWVPGWASFVRELNPAVIGWNGLRALNNPRNYQEGGPNVQQLLDDNWQAGRLLYSSFEDPALKGEFIRRMENGEDPALLAMELQNPGAEMVGQIIYDPLNIIGYAAKGVNAFVTLGKTADRLTDVAKVSPVLDDLVRLADKSTEIKGFQAIDEMTDAQLLATKAVRNSLDDFSKATGLFQRTTEGKRFVVNRRIGEIADFVVGNSKSPDEALEVMKALVLRASDDAAEVRTGLMNLKQFPALRPLFARSGQELGIVMREMLTNDAGKVDWNGFLKGFQAAQEGGVETMVKFMDSKLAKGIDDLFPTHFERIQNGEKIGRLHPVNSFLVKFDKAAKGKIYTPVNRFFASLYMGMNPGYAFRNMMTNTVHILADTGPVKGWSKGTFWNPKMWVPRTQEWLGTVPKSMVEAFGAHSTEIGTSRGKWYEKMLAVSESMEQKAAMRVVGASVQDTMTRLLRPGKALPEIGGLVEAGVDARAANALYELSIKHKGDVVKAAQEWTKLAADGNMDVVKSLTLFTDQDITWLNKWTVYDEVVEALGKDTLPETLRALDEVVADQANMASKAVDDIAGFTENSRGFEDLGPAADANKLGHFSNETARVVSNRYEANSQAINKIYELMNLLGRERSFKAAQVVDYQTARALDDLSNNLVQTLDEVWGKLKSESRAFTSSTWTDTYRLRELGENADWAQEWRKLGFLDDPPENLTKKEVLNYLWDVHFENSQKLMWAGGREMMGAGVQDFYKIVKEAIPNLDEGGELINGLDRAISQARVWDDVVVDGDKVFRVDVQIAHLLNNRNDIPGAIRVMAGGRYGIASIAPSGAKLDKVILATINKYSDDVYKALDDVPFAEAHKAFEARAVEKGFGSQVPDLARYGVQQVENVVEEVAPVAQVVDDTTPVPIDGKTQVDLEELNKQIEAARIKYENNPAKVLSIDELEYQTLLDQRAKLVKENFLDEADHILYDNLDSSVKEAEEFLRQVDKTDAALFESATISAQEARNELDAFIALSETVKRKIDEGPPIAQVTPEPIPVISPANLEHAPSAPRMMYEQLDGFTKYMDEIKGRVSENWGQKVPTPLDKNVQTALDDWVQLARGRVGEARLVATDVANAARKFTLHDYPDKRNIDLLLSYIYPYHFWYSRTYPKWLARIARNPETIAAYAKYKDGLAKIHAGAPEWWKYNVNSNELLGLDHENPLFFNLEATLNPVNGLTGIDFNDRLRHPEGKLKLWTQTIDDLGKYGPSVWTPFALATAIALSSQGEEEAAARWAGRLVPQTAAIRAGGALFNKNIELDPNVHIFGGGIEPYERRRIGRMLGTLIEEGQITQEQAADASFTQEGEIWELATQRALDNRSVGQISSFLMGVGFKGRTPTDIEIDRAYSHYYSLWEQSDNYAPDEFRTLMEQFHQEYPYMNAVLLSRKAGFERDRAFAYNVMGRIPPGQKDDISEAMGIDGSLLDEFYATKGALDQWETTDRIDFMNGIVRMGAVLEMPDTATQNEWNAARTLYGQMADMQKEIFGEDIEDGVNAFYALKRLGDEYTEDVAQNFLDANPLVEAAMDWRTEAILGNELLASYYGSLNMVDNYYKGQYFDEIEQRFGEDIFDLSDTYWNEVKPQEDALWEEYNRLKDQEDRVWQGYWRLRDSGDDQGARDYFATYLDDDMPSDLFYDELLEESKRPTKMFLNSNPRLQQYWDTKGELKEMFDLYADQAGDLLPEGLPLEIRSDTEDAGLIQEQFIQEFSDQPAVSADEWRRVLDPALFRLVEDLFIRGAALPPQAEQQLESVAQSVYGIPPEFVLEQLAQAFLTPAPAE